MHPSHSWIPPTASPFDAELAFPASAPLNRTLSDYADRVDAGDYTPQQVAELLGKNEIQLIDVRELDENQAGRIAGGRLIQLGDLAAQVDSIDRDRPVVFYCRTGARSAMATTAFRQAGFDAHNMTGGLVEWQAAGLPLEPADGHVA
jgi:hydroxyacylglutathione hydrolase/adenylyltransferase/sulfurtransferase